MAVFDLTYDRVANTFSWTEFFTSTATWNQGNDNTADKAYINVGGEFLYNSDTLTGSANNLSTTDTYRLTRSGGGLSDASVEGTITEIASAGTSYTEIGRWNDTSANYRTANEADYTNFGGATWCANRAPLNNVPDPFPLNTSTTYRLRYVQGGSATQASAQVIGTPTQAHIDSSPGGGIACYRFGTIANMTANFGAPESNPNSPARFNGGQWILEEQTSGSTQNKIRVNSTAAMIAAFNAGIPNKPNNPPNIDTARWNSISPSAWNADTDYNQNGYANVGNSVYRALQDVSSGLPVEELGRSNVNLGSGSWDAAVAVGDRVWFVDNTSNNARGYNHSNGALTRNTSADINLGSGSWDAAVAVGDRVWFVDNTSNNARGYNHSNGALTRNSASDVNLGTGDWSAGAVAVNNDVWFVNNTTNTATAYTHSNGALTRNSASDVNLGTGDWRYVTLRIADNNKIEFVNTDNRRWYDYNNGTLSFIQTQNTFSFELNRSDSFSIGNYLWIIDRASFAARGFVFIPTSSSINKYVGIVENVGNNFSSVNRSVVVGNQLFNVQRLSTSVTVYVYNITNNIVDGASQFSLQLTGNPNADFGCVVSVGNRIFITNENNNTTYTWNITTNSSGATVITYNSAGVNLGSGSWDAAVAVGDRVWFVDNTSNNARGYNHSNGALTRNTSADINLGSGSWDAAVAVGDRVWFVDNTSNNARGYNHSNGALTRNTSADINLGTGDWDSATAYNNRIWFFNKVSGSTWKVYDVPTQPSPPNQDSTNWQLVTTTTWNNTAAYSQYDVAILTNQMYAAQVAIPAVTGNQYDNPPNFTYELSQETTNNDFRLVYNTASNTFAWTRKNSITAGDYVLAYNNTTTAFVWRQV